jgi:hypothetical protein
LYSYGEFSEDFENGLITVNSVDTLGKITNYDGYYIEKATIDTFVSQVASWLSTANNGARYADVTTALKSGNDVSELMDKFYNFNSYGNDDCGWVKPNP